MSLPVSAIPLLISQLKVVLVVGLTIISAPASGINFLRARVKKLHI